MPSTTVIGESSPVEVIVADDASDDATPDIAADHPAVTAAVRLPRRGGAGMARNAGLHRATGDTVVFMDADMVPADHQGWDLPYARRGDT